MNATVATPLHTPLRQATCQNLEGFRVLAITLHHLTVEALNLLKGFWHSLTLVLPALPSSVALDLLRRDISDSAGFPQPLSKCIY
jgi:hypothetical protein